MICGLDTCKESFKPKRKDSKFCSTECRKRDQQNKSNAARRLKNKISSVKCHECHNDFACSNSRVKYCPDCQPIIKARHNIKGPLHKITYTVNHQILTYQKWYSDFSKDPDIIINPIYLHRGRRSMRIGLGQIEGAEV